MNPSHSIVRLSAMTAAHAAALLPGHRWDWCPMWGRGMLYIFYCGDLPGYEKLSPVSLITQSIYDYARAKGFSLLGIGTSTKQGIPSSGLRGFKRELGCVESLKLAFVKRLV
jgi:hypothetical protein